VQTRRTGNSLPPSCPAEVRWLAGSLYFSELVDGGPQVGRRRMRVPLGHLQLRVTGQNTHRFRARAIVHQLRDEVLAVLAAVVRLLLTLLRISGFRLSGERLPAGDDKARVLRAIAGAADVTVGGP
jgi:hypothetical protein